MLRVMLFAAAVALGIPLWASAQGVPDFAAIVAAPDRSEADRAVAALEARTKTPAGRNITPLVRPFDDPLPPEQRDLDLVTYFFFYHDTAYLMVDRAEMNRKLFAALKPGGLMIVADHSAKAGDGVNVARTLHRIEESVLRREVEAAGFKLIEEGNFLRQPQDPRDFRCSRSRPRVLRLTSLCSSSRSAVTQSAQTS